MALIDTLKQIIPDAANDIDKFFESYCPSEYGLEEKCGGYCEDKPTGFCPKCWAAAIEKAEQEEV